MLLLVGRDGELALLKENLAKALTGEGNTTLVSGEPGIGKTALADEFLARAKNKDVRIISGTAVADRFEPFLMFSKALEGVVELPLFEEEESVSFTEVLAVDLNGLLLAKATHGEEEIDADIFAAMFSAVQNFVNASMKQAGQSDSELGRLEYGDLKILIEHGRHLFLTGVFKGTEHGEMTSVLRDNLRHIESAYSGILEDWKGDTASVKPISDELQSLVDRRFTVKRDMEGVDIESERARIANRVLEEVRALADERPLLLFLEDLHWADQSSLFVLNYLVRNIGSDRIQVVATYRPGESLILKPVLGNMIESSIVTEIKLSQLGRNSVGGIVDSIYRPNRFPEDFVESIATRCEGNPFFVLEMLRHMEEENNIGRTAGSYVIVNQDYEIPDSLEGVVHRRLGTLEPDAMTLAEYGSCIGREFECRTLLSLDSLQDPGQAFEEVQERSLMVRNNGTGEFIHAIYQSVIYDEINQRWKTAYHRRLGDYYETVYEDNLEDVIYELARHFSRSNEHSKAFDYSYRAGMKAEAAFASEQAAEFFRTALAALDALPRTDGNRAKKLELMEKLADALRNLGELPGAIELYEQLEQEYEGQGDPLLRILLKLSRSRFAKGDQKMVPDILKRGVSAVPEASTDMATEYLASLSNGLMRSDPEVSRKYLEEAMPMLDDVSDMTTLSKALSLLAGVLAVMNEGQKALELYRRGSKAARESGDLRAIANADRTMAGHMHFQGDFVECTKILQDVLEMHERLGDIVAMYGTLNSIGIAYSDNNALEKSVEAHERALAIARKLGNQGYIATSQGNLGYTLTGLGQLDKALTCHAESLAIREKVDGKDGTAWSHSDIGLVYYQAGNMEAAEASHRKSLDIWERLDSKLGIALENFYLGEIFAARGDRETALGHFKTSIELGRRHGHKSPLFYSLKGLLELPAGGEAEFAEFEELAEQIGRPDMFMMVHRLKADRNVEAGDLDAAAVHIAKAEQVGKDADPGVTVETEGIRVMLAKAKLLLAGNDTEAAKELALDAARRFRKRGYRFEAGQAENWAAGI